MTGTVRSPGITGSVAVLLLAIFWVATLVGDDVRKGPPPPHLEARLRRLFEDNAPGIRALAVPMNGLFHLYGGQDGTAKTVLVASSSTRGGILFFSPETDLERVDSRSHAVFVRNLGALGEKVAALRQAGAARVFLVPVPTKLSVALAVDPSLRVPVPDIPAGPLPARTSQERRIDGRRTQEAYERFLAAFGGLDGVQVVALQKVFIAQAAAVEDPVFGYEDTHWTSLGLNLAAREILWAWRGRRPIAIVKTGQAPDVPGDLQRMLALPDHPWFRTHPMSEDLYDLRTDPGTEPCPDATFLLGTSYSNYRGKALAGPLGRGSGCRVTDLSHADGGLITSFRRLVQEHTAGLRGAVVIWEFPFRDLADDRSFTAR
jgi:hypothetical protein